MLLDVDLDREDRIVTGPGTNEPLSLISFKRDTSGEIRVRFWSAGVQTELADAAVGSVGIKEAGKYDADPLVFAGAWTKEGTGAATVYVFTPALNGVALSGLLLSGDGNPDNDKEFVSGMFEIKWVADGKKHRTQTVPALIYNDVLKDPDGTPPEFPAIFAAPLVLTAPPKRRAFATITVDANTGSSWSLSVGLVEIGESAPVHANPNAYAAYIAAQVNLETDFPFIASSLANAVTLTSKDDGDEGNGAAFNLTGVDLTANSGGAEELSGGYCEEATALLQHAKVTTVQGGKTYVDVWHATGIGDDSDWAPPGNIFEDETLLRNIRQISTGGAPFYQPAYP